MFWFDLTTLDFSPMSYFERHKNRIVFKKRFFSFRGYLEIRFAMSIFKLNPVKGLLTILQGTFFKRKSLYFSENILLSGVYFTLVGVQYFCLFEHLSHI